jgi:hypothetical protein
MAHFVNSSSSTHQGVERAEKMLHTVRSLGTGMLKYPLEVLAGLPQGWNHYVACLERQLESDEQLLAMTDKDSDMLRQVQDAARRERQH